MSEEKIVAVFGATGTQGGGLVRAILSDPKKEFKVTAITRNVDSDKGKALAAQGVEVVSADLDDQKSIEKALAGAYGAFFVTSFWEHFSAEKETEQAKNISAASKTAGVKHVIWSTLEDVRKFYPLSDDRMPTLQGKYKVSHFDGKGQGDEFFKDAGVPTTYFYASFYWDNLIYFGMGPSRGEDGKLSITFPMGKGKLSGIAAEDIGKCALGVCKRPELIGRQVGIAGGQPTLEEMASTLSSAIGEPVRYNDISYATYRSFGFPGADDLANMFQFYQEHEDHCVKLRDVKFSKELNPELQDFKTWVGRNVGKLVK